MSGNFLDEPQFSDGQLKAKDVLDALEGEDCKCFAHWDPEKCGACGHRFDKHRQARGCHVSRCRCERYVISKPPRCPHVKKAEHSFKLERLAKLQRDLLPEEYEDRPQPAAATAALPGGEDKIMVMAERVARLESPCHPDDLQLEQCTEHLEMRPLNSQGEEGPERNGRVTSRQLVRRTSTSQEVKHMAWRCILPDGRVVDGIIANSKSEARTEAKRLLSIGKKDRLPPGTMLVLEKAEARTEPARKELSDDKRKQVQGIVDRCNVAGIALPKWVKGLLSP